MRTCRDRFCQGCPVMSLKVGMTNRPPMSISFPGFFSPRSPPNALPDSYMEFPMSYHAPCLSVCVQGPYCGWASSFNLCVICALPAGVMTLFSGSGLFLFLSMYFTYVPMPSSLSSVQGLDHIYFYHCLFPPPFLLFPPFQVFPVL